MASYINSPFKNLYLYPIILSLTSNIKNASRIESFISRKLPILSNIYSNILVL